MVFPTAFVVLYFFLIGEFMMFQSYQSTAFAGSKMIRNNRIFPVFFEVIRSPGIRKGFAGGIIQHLSMYPTIKHFKLAALFWFDNCFSASPQGDFFLIS